MGGRRVPRRTMGAVWVRKEVEPRGPGGRRTPALDVQVGEKEKWRREGRETCSS